MQLTKTDYQTARRCLKWQPTKEKLAESLKA